MASVELLPGAGSYTTGGGPNRLGDARSASGLRLWAKAAVRRSKLIVRVRGSEARLQPAVPADAGTPATRTTASRYGSGDGESDPPVLALSTFMGHANIRITLDQYGYLLPGAEGEAAELLDAVLTRSARKKPTSPPRSTCRHDPHRPRARRSARGSASSSTASPQPRTILAEAGAHTGWRADCTSPAQARSLSGLAAMYRI